MWGFFIKDVITHKIVKGTNPIVQHEYIGRDIEGQDVLIIDDMIATGESIFDIAKELKARKAKNIYVAATFALFTDGIEKFDAYYKSGLFKKIYSTNLAYVPDVAKSAEWFHPVDMSCFIANLIDNLNNDESISPLLAQKEGIELLLKEYNL